MLMEKLYLQEVRYPPLLVISVHGYTKKERRKWSKVRGLAYYLYFISSDLQLKHMIEFYTYTL